MAENGTSGPASATTGEGDAREPSAGPPAEGCGPLQLERLRKEDGRALISYRRRDEPER